MMNLESPNEWGDLRNVLNRDRQKRGTGVSKIYDEPDSPDQRACLRYVMKRNRQMRGRVQDI